MLLHILSLIFFAVDLYQERLESLILRVLQLLRSIELLTKLLRDSNTPPIQDYSLQWQVMEQSLFIKEDVPQEFSQLSKI